MKKKKNEDISTYIKQMEDIGKRIKLLEKNISDNNSKFYNLIMLLPNYVHDSVPVGKDPTNNVIIRTHGTIKKFDYTIRNHIDIGESVNLIDIEKAAKISGSRFYFLKNDLVKLNHAIISFALDFVSEKGYTLLQPPYMITKNAMEGAVILEDFKDVIYKIQDEDLFLIGTSEHAMAAMHMDEILEGSKLPLRYAGFSPCFRKEAGAHGKDMKGIFRVHQFEKVEQFVVTDSPNSSAEHERMLSITERFYQNLEIPFRIVLLSSADTGKVSSKTYDIEAWMPGQDKYREIASCSNCIDFQARRLRIRHRGKVNEETQLVHTLNSTLVATERTMVAILENYKTTNQSVIVPTVLRKYMGDMKEIKVK